jgi:predicted Ser/Thr protein kinase
MTDHTSIGIAFLMFCILIGAFLIVILFVLWINWRSSQNETQQPKRPQADRVRRANEVDLRRRETTAACPECGAALSADSPEGLCPRCLLHHALKTPSPTPTGDHGAFIAPDPADLAAHFPQLEILSLLGQGGMGAVYKARQLKLDRFVAVKILPAEWGRDPAFAERFAREARALAKLSHPHIVGVHDFGEAGEHFYLLMEFVDGANLRQLLQAGPLDPRLALQIIPQVCDALQYAHDEGVIHRDVKPENILVDQRGRVKMADFGLAKLVGPSRASFTLTGTHQVMGTLDYMAPEQRNHPQEVDQRADIYSLGVVFYEMLTGKLPLGRFSPPSDAAGVDVRLDEIVHRALEREPEQRYQHVSEVRSALESVTDGAANAVRSPEPTDAEYVQLQVQGPAAALIISASVALAFWVLVAAYILAENNYPTTSIPIDVRVVIMTYELPLILTFSALALAGVIIAGADKLRHFNGYGFVIAASILAMLPWSPHCLIGIPAGIWAFLTLKRPEVRAAFAANLRRKQLSQLAPIPGGVAFRSGTPFASEAQNPDRQHLMLLVRGPAAALNVTAAVALVSCLVFLYVVVNTVMNLRWLGPEDRIPTFWPPFWMLAVGVVAMCTITIRAGAACLRSVFNYEIVVTGIIAAMLPVSPHCLIGIPAGIWAIWTLRDPKVKAAFAANLRRKQRPRMSAIPADETARSKETGPVLRKARSFWRSLYSVFLSSPTHEEESAAPTSPSEPK